MAREMVSAVRDFEQELDAASHSMLLLAARLTDWNQAEDIVQDALARAWKKRDQFDPDKGNLRAWLLAITADQVRQVHRRAALRARLPWHLLHEPVVRDPTEPDVDLEIALRKLSNRQRTAVLCHYYLDLSIADVAEVMRCSTGTVKSTLHDARTRLRGLLDGGAE